MPALGTWGFIVTFSGQGLRNVVGWWAFGVIAAISGVMLFIVFVREGHRVPWRALPPIASAYTVLCMASVIWSHYPRETVLAGLLMLATTATGVLLACGLSLRQFTDALSRALETTLVLSLLLELYVALVLRHPLIPIYMKDWSEVPPSYIWVEGNIFQGGPIQGIVGNRNPLAFIALLTLICVVVRWRDYRLRLPNFLIWSTLSIMTLILTGSATVIVAAVVCGIVMLFLWLLRHVPVALRTTVIVAASTLGVAVIVFAIGWHSQVTALLGRSPDMSGRSVIWHAVEPLVGQRPIGGWGWFIGWPTWMEPFASLVIRPDGTPTNQAHNVYVEAALTTGFVGAFLVTSAIVWTLFRVVKVAVAHIDDNLWDVVPAVLMIAMFIQSFTESRMLFEGNWMLVVIIATWVKVRGEVPVVWPSAARQHLEYS